MSVVSSSTTGANHDKEDIVVFVNYRTVFEADSLDTANCESWKEVLDAFGYSKFTRIGFLRELSLATPAEVMQSLCPYTTKSEWGPVLTKRHVRLEREIKSLCSVELLPLQGLKDFLISCAKQCRQLTTIFLSPFNEACTRVLLQQSEMEAFVDLTHCYTEREFAIVEALEMLNLPPPIVPEHLNHRWQTEGEVPSADTTRTRFVSFEADPTGVAFAIEYGIAPIGVSYNCFEEKVRSGITGGALSPEASLTNSAVVSPKRVASYAARSDDDDDEGDLSSIDDEEENEDAESGKARRDSKQLSPHRAEREDIEEEGMTGHLKDAEDGGSSVGTKGDATLLDSGVVTVIRDFSSMNYEYLPHMIPAPCTPYERKK